jgi:hypothetical protein
MDPNKFPNLLVCLAMLLEPPFELLQFRVSHRYSLLLEYGDLLLIGQPRIQPQLFNLVLSSPESRPDPTERQQTQVLVLMLD